MLIFFLLLESKVKNLHITATSWGLHCAYFKHSHVLRCVRGGAQVAGRGGLQFREWQFFPELPWVHRVFTGYTVLMTPPMHPSILFRRSVWGVIVLQPCLLPTPFGFWSLLGVVEEADSLLLWVLSIVLLKKVLATVCFILFGILPSQREALRISVKNGPKTSPRAFISHEGHVFVVCDGGWPQLF